MRRRLPPLLALRAFEAAARHLNFGNAAEELLLTPGAISHHVRHLETELGVALFVRTTRAVSLTPHGEQLLGTVCPLAQAAFDQPSNMDIQLDLFGDYKSNVGLYPTFQAYFRDRKPPLLAVSGKNDSFFLPAGVEAYKRDDPNAEMALYDTGHLALETDQEAIGARIMEFLGRALP
jgi:pimeloyl-ACP methyl ester carboxylesterase